MMGIEEGTFWDEHWVLYGNQFDSKFHLLKKKDDYLNNTVKNIYIFYLKILETVHRYTANIKIIPLCSSSFTCC